MEFEWDEAKELDNIRKHGLTFSQAVESFFDPKGFVLEDQKHSKREQRFFWLGKNKAGRVLTTRFTRRGSKFRIFGCAEWRDFKKIYNETTKSKKA